MLPFSALCCDATDYKLTGASWADETEEEEREQQQQQQQQQQQAQAAVGAKVAPVAPLLPVPQAAQPAVVPAFRGPGTPGVLFTVPGSALSAAAAHPAAVAHPSVDDHLVSLLSDAEAADAALYPPQQADQNPAPEAAAAAGLDDDLLVDYEDDLEDDAEAEMRAAALAAAHALQ